MSQRIVIALGYLGILPFIAATLCMLLGASPGGFDPLLVFLAYSAVILSFLGGVMWGRVLSLPDERAVRYLLLLSNAIALAGFAGLLLTMIDGGGYRYALALLMGGFIIMLVAERLYHRQLFADVQRNYFAMRMVLTLAVVAMHGVLMVFH